MKYSRKLSYYPIVVGGILLGLLPLLGVGTYILYVLVIVFIFGMLAVSWDLLAGYAGQLSFGQAGYFGLGAYGAVLLVKYTTVPAWLSLVLGPIISMVFGLSVAIPCLRLKGPYLSLTTLAFAEVLRVVTQSWVNFTGGPLGLSGYRTLEWIPITREAFYYIGLILLFLVLVVSVFLINSHIGIRFMAIRDDDILASSIGYDTTRYKIIAFVLSAAIAGVAGSFYGLYILVISPLVFDISITVLAISMVIIGGKGTIFGPVIGAFLVQFFSEYFRSFGGYRLFLVGIVTILMVLFFPGGVWNMMIQLWTKLSKSLKPSKKLDLTSEAQIRRKEG